MSDVIDAATQQDQQCVTTISQRSGRACRVLAGLSAISIGEAGDVYRLVDPARFVTTPPL
jgi:hypothetical protein